MMDYKERMFTLPEEKDWTIYTKNNCIFCIKVKKLLENYNIKIIECDEWLNNNRNDFLNWIYNIIGYEYKTFPMVFYNNKFIGGFTDTEKYIIEKDKINNNLVIEEDF